jgi:hypothetical protein
MNDNADRIAGLQYDRDKFAMCGKCCASIDRASDALLSWSICLDGTLKCPQCATPANGTKQ